MPFPKNRWDFNKASIESLKQNQIGVYGIFNSQKCVYVGKAKCLHTRLLEHFNHESDQSNCIWSNSPTYFQGVIVDQSNLDNEEMALIKEYDPICNKT